MLSYAMTWLRAEGCYVVRHKVYQTVQCACLVVVVAVFKKVHVKDGDKGNVEGDPREGGTVHSVAEGGGRREQ